MLKNRIKYFLDFIPLIILATSATLLFWTISTTNIVLQSEHYLGLIFLILTAVLFAKSHKLGVIILGITILLGIFKVLSFSPAITSYSIGGSINEHSSYSINIQVIFILWLFVHLVLSWRHYVGIMTKKYWQDILYRSESLKTE